MKIALVVTSIASLSAVIAIPSAQAAGFEDMSAVAGRRHSAEAAARYANYEDANVFTARVASAGDTMPSARPRIACHGASQDCGGSTGGPSGSPNQTSAAEPAKTEVFASHVTHEGDAALVG